MKNQVVLEIMEMIADDIEECDIREIRSKISVVLGEYDIELKKKEIMCIDHSWIVHLEKFIVQKMIEGKSKNTLKQYTYELKRFLGYTNKNISDIQDTDIYKYMLFCKEIRKNGNQTLENRRLIFSSFFTWLYKSRVITINPMDTINPIKIEKKIKKPFTEEERQILFENCKDTREKAMTEFMYSTWVRVSELSNLKISDIDFNNNEVKVFGKGNKERVVYLNAMSKMYLKKYLKERKVDSEYVFISNKVPYDNLCKASIESILRNLGKRAKVENVHPHRYRRTGATNALLKGMPIEQVSKILGHVKLETTMIYCMVNEMNTKMNFIKYFN